MLMLKRSNDLISKWEKEVTDLIYKDYFVADYDLLDWNTIPALWFSTWALDNQQAENLVYAALKIWYRLIDTSRAYDNELWVWRGIKKAIDEWLVTREDIFVTTKVVPSNYSDPNKEVDISLKNLWLDYIKNWINNKV